MNAMIALSPMDVVVDIVYSVMYILITCTHTANLPNIFSKSAIASHFNMYCLVNGSASPNNNQCEIQNLKLSTDPTFYIINYIFLYLFRLPPQAFAKEFRNFSTGLSILLTAA